MASKFKVTTIQPNECIGNSLNTINTNFTNLETRANELQTFSNSIVDFVNNGLLFQPVNYDTRSNDTVIIEDEKPKNKNLNAKPWWSNSYTVSIPKIPNTCVGVLVHVYFNTNSIRNNGMAFYIKDRNAAAGNDNTAPVKAEQNRYNLKFNMDPNDGKTQGFEAETNVTFPVYLDTINEKGCKKNTFQWRISDNRATITKQAPDYYVKISLLGYYLDLNLNKLA
jgi:hypothetical protein